MIADTSPLGRIGPHSLNKTETAPLHLQPDQRNDRLNSFFSTLSWTDRQVLALHFAEHLSPWEIHVVLNMSMSDVLCRIQRLQQIARKSLQLQMKISPPKLTIS
ncbi:MAG: hypothetical protein VX436_00655 [Planctomycetota bacterium]|nr:hypothetical protein [Planctomycetota bacterium]